MVYARDNSKRFEEFKKTTTIAEIFEEHEARNSILISGRDMMLQDKFELVSQVDGFVLYGRTGYCSQSDFTFHE